MILRWDSGSTEKETCHITTLSTLSLTWTNPGSDLDLHGDRPVTTTQAMEQAVQGTTNAFRKAFKHTVFTPQKTQ